LARASVSATISATGSPTWRTRSAASSGRGVSPRGLPSGLVTGIMHGISPRPSAFTSAPVSTASTPGAFRAADASIRRIAACACGDRSTYACASPASRTSSA
jgi:hypothetical protein